MPSLKSFFGPRSFNTSLKALTACLGTLVAHAKATHPGVQVPFEVGPGTLEGLSVTYTRGQEERWARAMACLALNLRWLLVWVLRPTAP